MRNILLLLVLLTLFNNVYNITTNLPERKYGMGVVGYQNCAIFAGGRNGSTFYNTVDVLCISSTTTNWVSITPLTESRSLLAGAVVGNKAYFGGGVASPNVPSSIVDVYNLDTRQRLTPFTLLQARYDLSVAALGNFILWAGGINSSMVSSNHVDILDTTTAIITPAALSYPRTDMAAATVGTYVFFAGGFTTGGAASATIDVFSLKSFNFIPHSFFLSEARYDANAAVWGDSIYIAGGIQSVVTKERSKVIDICSIGTGRCAVYNLTTPRNSMGVVATKETVYFYGGKINDTATYSSMDVYKPESNFLAVRVAVAESRSFTTAVSIMDKYAVFAGGVNNLNQITDLVEIICDDSSCYDCFLEAPFKCPNGSCQTSLPSCFDA